VCFEVEQERAGTRMEDETDALLASFLVSDAVDVTVCSV
jgi:hypothetical protein